MSDWIYLEDDRKEPKVVILSSFKQVCPFLDEWRRTLRRSSENRADLTGRCHVVVVNSEEMTTLDRTGSHWSNYRSLACQNIEHSTLARDDCERAIACCGRNLTGKRSSLYRVL